MDAQRESVETVYSSNRRKGCLRYALVLEAVGIDHEILREDGAFVLVVSSSDATRARAELEAYQQENRGWRTPVVPFPYRGGGWEGVLGYTALILLAAICDGERLFGSNWFSAGKINAGFVREGEWWRAVTALTLHVDLAHLVSNVAIGGLVGLFAGRLLGCGLAWFSILIAATAGNLINTWIRHPEYTSVGASTAVFAALGMIAGYAWKLHRQVPASRLKRWAPLVAGVVLLAFFGTGGGRTDVGAHVAGFGCGALVGAIHGMLGDRAVFKAKGQVLFGVAAVVAVALAWALALVMQRAPQLS